MFILSSPAHHDPTSPSALGELLDREAIRECLYRYCRGIDRCDEAALRSVYWDDATDRHGPYSGSASGFIVWVLDRLATSERSIHFLGNLSIALHGDWAAVESYFQAFQRRPNPDPAQREVFLAGRYIDRFEKRNAEWRIARRVVVYDWVRPLGTPEGTETERFGPRQPVGAPWPHDPVYALLSGGGQ
ncbi:nuclear transport factor 2 family protein [Cupriavidus necator]|nr:nuclear transport factor 2 family protein [Cupriavidus necator]